MFIIIKFPEEFRQLLPVICGALISVSFGMMLGWPSSAYPYLLNEEVTPIRISLDETALIAGFLLEGNAIGGLFSTSKFIPCKLAICLCSCLQVAGWILMFFSADIFWFLASRASIGFANGYSSGQLRRYIKETCDPKLAKIINQYLPLGMNVGVLIIFILGACMDFRSMAIYSVALPIFCLISFTIIPKKIREDPTKRLNTVISVRDKTDIIKNMTSLQTEQEIKPVNIFDVLKCKTTRNTLLLIFLLVFVQQYSGGPAHIVYSQIIFTSTLNPYPKICSILYAAFFLITMFISLKYLKNFSRKKNLIVSTTACILALSLLSLYFLYRHEVLKVNHQIVWAPLFLLLIYNFFHTVSYGTLPLLLITEIMPKHSRNVAYKFWTFHFSMSAVISTKIFQVLFGIFGMWIGYVFFISVLAGGLLIELFINNYSPNKKQEITSEDTVEVGQTNIAYENTETHTKF